MENTTQQPIWQAQIGKYLNMKIRQGNKGENDWILVIRQSGHKDIYQAVDKDEFLKEWNKSRREAFVSKQINNDTQLRWELEHACNEAIKNCTNFYKKHIYHDLPNVLLGIAECEAYGESRISQIQRRKSKGK